MEDGAGCFRFMACRSSRPTSGVHPFHPQSAGQPTHTEGWEMQGSREMGEYYHPRHSPKIIAALVLIC